MRSLPAHHHLHVMPPLHPSVLHPGNWARPLQTVLPHYTRRGRSSLEACCCTCVAVPSSRPQWPSLCTNPYKYSTMLSLMLLALMTTPSFSPSPFVRFTQRYMCSFFAACDHFQWLQEHKLPRTPRMLPSVEKMKRTLLEAAFHQLLVGPLAMYGVYHLVGGVPSVHTPLGNSMFEVWKHFILAEVFYETGFYAFHRTVHESTFLYKLIHKKHHSYIGTVSIASEHTNVFEAVLLPTVGYCLYNRVHIVILLTYVAWRYFETYELHSGYCFKNTRLSKMGLLHAHRTEFHDFHHTDNVGTFGVFPSCGLDVVFRSMDHYLVHLEEKKGTNTNDKKQIDSIDQRAF